MPGIRDKRALHDDLTNLFIGYQYRLESPMPSQTETPEIMIDKFRRDPIFNAKVRSMVYAVMAVVSKHEDS